MLLNKLNQLKAARAKVASLEQSIQAKLNRELAALPAKYGFESAAELAKAIVAAGGLPMAHATDGGGSIRIPASLCGLFGLKPSRGRISLAPIGETLAGAGAQHAVTVSVRDSAALLDILAGGEPGDPYAAPAAGSFFAATRRPPGKLRVAFMRKPVGGEPLLGAVGGLDLALRPEVVRRRLDPVLREGADRLAQPAR